jgi:hypothetical protein
VISYLSIADRQEGTSGEGSGNTGGEIRASDTSLSTSFVQLCFVEPSQLSYNPRINKKK